MGCITILKNHHLLEIILGTYFPNIEESQIPAVAKMFEFKQLMGRSKWLEPIRSSVIFGSPHS